MRGFGNPYFGSAWGGAAAGAAQAGRGATLGQILALAAMGSSEGLYRQQEFEEERERRRLEEEERARERQMRLEEYNLRMEEARARADERQRETAAGNVADEFAMSEAFDAGPRNDVMPPAAFAQPGQFADYWASEAKSDLAEAQMARRHERAIAGLEAAGIAPSGERDLDIKKFEKMYLDEGEKPSWSETRYWLDKAEDEQEEYDKDWSDWFNSPEGPGGRPKAQAAELQKQNDKWDDAYNRNKTLVRMQAEKGTPEEEIIKRAAEVTDGEIGPRPTPKRPVPAAKQSLNPSLTGLPPAGGKVAPPTGSAPPPVAVPPPKQRTAAAPTDEEAEIQRELAMLPRNLTPQERRQAEEEIRAIFAQRRARARPPLSEQGYGNPT